MHIRMGGARMKMLHFCPKEGLPMPQEVPWVQLLTLKAMSLAPLQKAVFFPK